MKYSVEFLPKAELELFKAQLWYDEQKAGLGNTFKLYFVNGVDTVAKNPRKFQT